MTAATNALYSSMPASAVAIPRNEKNPATSVIVVRMIVDDCAGSGVCDEGCGFPEDPEPLFESFATTKPNGLGMGLAICRTICRAHGGRIWAANGPQRGASLTFELPAYRKLSP